MASGKRGYARGYNQDHRPPGRPPPMHYQRDMMNFGFIQQFHAYKETGNTAMTRGDYQAAFQSYSSALQQVELISLGISERDVAKVFCNRSLVALKLGCIDLAFEDGFQSIQMDPMWVKGYWRVSSALREKNPIQAVEVLVDGYSKITGDNELATKADFIREIATLSLKLWPRTQTLYYKCRAPPNVWSKVVLQLAKQKETKVLHFVFLGGRPMSQGRGMSGMAMNCDASPVQLKPLIRSMGPSDRNRYGMDLMLALIKHGADWKGLSIKDGDTPLHVALNHGMEIADFDFLKYLFQHHAKTREERSQTDRDGSTLLHLAAKQKTKQREEALVFLLNENVDPNVKDRNEKTPVDYVTDDWMLVGTLRSWMKKSNNISYSSKVKGGGPEATSDGVTKKKQRTFYQSGPQGSGHLPGPTVIPERTRRPYSSQNPTVLPSREEMERTQRPYTSQKPTVLPERPRQSHTSQSPTVLPERTRRPYSAAAGVKPGLSQPKSSQKASYNQQSQQHQPKSKTKMNQNAKQPKKQREYGTRYERGLQLKRNKHYDQALKAFFQCMESQNASLSKQVENCRQEVINTLELPDLKEVSKEVRCALDSSYWNQTILELQDLSRWRALFFLLHGGGNDYEYGMGGVAKGCDVSKVSILKCLKSRIENIEKIKVIKALLENGAKPNGLPDEDMSPVKYCLQVDNIKYYTMVTALIRKEAKPEDLIEVPGDSPLHSGLRMCLKYKDRKLDLLNVLLEKYSKSKNDQYLDPTETNMDDDSLFHIALNEKDEALSLEAVKLLSKNKVNPYLKNKAGKIPITQIKKTDRRYQFLEEAARHHPKKGKKGPKKQKGSARSGDTSEVSPDASPFYTPDSIPKTKHEKKAKVQTPSIDKQELKRKIALLIKDVLPVIKPAKSDNKKLQKQRETKRQVQQEDDEEFEDDDTNEKVGAQKEPESKDLEDLEAADLQEIDSTVFDNLVWEVECTAKVWKFLRDRHVPEKIRKAVVNKIQRLGEGNWSKTLAKSLKCDHIYLYEAKVTSGGRILWQKAIAFSPKCSVVPEERLAENKDEFGGIEGGRIYADVIRVWDVVLDHDNVQHAIDVIVKSVDRGQECILQKKLRGIKKKSIGQAMKIPNLYQEIQSDDVPEAQVATKKQDFFPPASSKETEYHIMKFYSFSSNLVNNILHDSNTRVDFPFRVTEKEHAIIHINPKPPCSLLLLGRSGTGKTTCCLYRLWSSFVGYWNNAASDNEPRIPRDFCFRHSKDADEETDDGTDDSEMSDSAETNLEGSEVGGAAASADPEDAEEDEDEIVYDHLHQIFITKNRVLCSEVRKNFRELAHGCVVASHYLKAEDQQHPHRLQDAPIAAFPYFLNSRQFLLILDASLPGTPFFERNPDGSLKKEIREWQEGDSQQPFLEMMDMDDDSDDGEEDEEEDEEENEREFDPDAEEKVQRKKVAYDARHEVTYEVFANQFWTKMKKKNLDYHPTLVWMEIRSFIKGSIEALHSENGKLDLEEYQKLGKKRAPNFTGDRKEVYDLYKKYEHMKRQQFYFDEADVVFNIYRRLQDVEAPDWAIHQIYVDETQDFTQAELALLIRCCSDPNAIFLTGDTAQSIMRGVAFRFNDLKSLFHYARNSMKALGKQASVAVPNKVYQLTHNYRSHAGILELAASVVDLLLFFFPSSFDRLKRDQGLFDGPKPVLLDSCSTSDLALILRGNKRKTSEIEFGAHQVILVANEQAKEQLPEELSLALCLTIFEAKGLEFDDVMIYNFFKDSPAREEWRVVQEHLKDIQNQAVDTDSNTSSLFELDIDVMNSAEQPRKLSFDPDKHKVLNSELKYLYTAISRARVNVWIFDEDNDNRRPMFQYFKARKLVSVLEAELDMSEQSKSLDVMFVEKSSAEDWEKRGDYFYNNGLWEVAVKCYLRAGNHQKVLKAKANHRVNEAEKMKGTNMAKMREWFLEAAHDFMQCGMHNEAARCLFNTKEFDLSAQLFEQIGDVAGAAKIYETRLKRYVDASRCHEKLGNYAMAVKVLKQNKEYDKAADVIERYEQRKSEEALPVNIIAPRDTIDTCCHQAAKHHYLNKAHNKMLESLNRLPNVDDRITFLKSRGKLYHYAVDILASEGRIKDAAEILKATGDLLQAINLCGEDQPEFRAECHLKLAKQKVRQLKALDLSKPILLPSNKFSGNAEVKASLPSSIPEDNILHEGVNLNASDNTENLLSEKEKKDNTREVETEENSRSEIFENQENEYGNKSEADLPKTELAGNASEIAEDDGSDKTLFDVKSSKDITADIFLNDLDGNRAKYQEYVQKREALVKDIKKHTEESLKLLKMSRNSKKQLFGDCKFILADLNDDASILTDAARNFHEAASDAGQMECFHLRIKLQDVHFRKIIDNLTRLYEFIQVLMNYDGTKNQQKVSSAEHFYEIDLGASPQTSTKIDEDEFKQARFEVVRKHCLPKATMWFKLVKEKLENTQVKLKQCPLFATGSPCIGNDCKHSHSVYRREYILQLVDCFVSMIRFIHCAKQWKILLSAEACEDIKSITKEIIGWEYQPCSELYDLIFPSHCNRRILTENHTYIKDFLKIIRQSPEVKLEMTEWVLSLRKSLNNRNKNCDTNVYLKALNIHRLVKEDSSVIKQWMKEDETQCYKYSVKNPNARLPLGMFLDGSRMVSFMERLLEYTNDIYVHGDPLKAIGSCNRFLVLIAKRPFLPLIPSIANTVAIMEHAFAVACAVTAKVQKCEVYLPASYLGLIHFQDELCRPHKRRYNLYQAVDFSEHFKPNELQGQIRQFVEMMTYGEKYRNFDIIPDAFKSRQYLESGEAERSFVLALVMLCNYRNLLGFESTFHLRCQLMPLHTGKHYPPRLARAVESVKSAKSLKDIMDVLQELLMQREAEFLMSCHWISSQRSNRYQSLYYAKVVTEQYKDISLGSLEGMNPMKPIKAEDDNMYHDVRGALDEVELSEQKKFEKAIIISKILSSMPTRHKYIPELEHIISEKGKLAVLVREQINKESVQESPEDQVKKSDHWIVLDMEEKTKIDEAWCGICYKVLDAKADERDLTIVPSSPIEGEVPEYHVLQHEVIVDETKNTQMEEHILSSEHTENVNYFKGFKENVINVIPSLEESASLNKRLENFNPAELEVFHDRLKDSQQRFIKKIREVIEKRQWRDFDQIRSTWSIFLKSYRELSEKVKRIEHTQHEIKPTVSAGAMKTNSELDDDVADLIRDEDDEEEHQTLNIRSTRKKVGKGGRQKKKKRKLKN